MMQNPKSGVSLMPPAVTYALWAIGGFALTAALLLWLERGPAILLDLSSFSSRFLCF